MTSVEFSVCDSCGDKTEEPYRRWYVIEIAGAISVSLDLCDVCFGKVRTESKVFRRATDKATAPRR